MLGGIAREENAGRRRGTDGTPLPARVMSPPPRPSKTDRSHVPEALPLHFLGNAASFGNNIWVKSRAIALATPGSGFSTAFDADQLLPS
jgi:hypothetical protein